MVFCGRPSRGCASCRKRRIKCDLTRPACSQCLRSRKLCAGYRDQLDLSFRNENEKVVSRIQLSQNAKATIPQHERIIRTRTSSSHRGHFQTILLQHTSATRYPLSDFQPTLNDEGVHFFYTTFVTIFLDKDPAGGLSTVTLAEIIPWYELHANGTIYNAVSCVGYAGLGNTTNNQKYAILARKRFAVALKAVNAALKQPQVSDLESVFKSVLLLSAFQLVSEPAGHAQDWSIHVEGGAALLQVMEAKRSRDIPIRQQLKLCLSTFSKYIGRQEPCSPNILAWTKICSDSIDTSDEPAIRLTRLLIAFTNLNASIGILPTPAKLAEVIDLESQMALWEASLPEAWSCTQDPTCEEKLIYRDLWTSSIWNDYRWVRICINDLIIRQTFNPAFINILDAMQIHHSLRTNAEMARGLYNSISCSSKVPIVKIFAAGHFLLLHPLAVVASGIGVSQDIHQAALDRLTTMGTKVGVRQALHLAEMSRKHRQEWKGLLSEWVD